MPVTLDPDAALVFKAFQEAGRPAYETLSPAEAREYYRQARFVTNPEPPLLKSVEPLAIQAAQGLIPARIYTPRTLRQSNGVAPCLVFFHGGGWVIGDLDTHDVVCRKLADEGQLIVISVDYRRRAASSSSEAVPSNLRRNSPILVSAACLRKRAARERNSNA